MGFVEDFEKHMKELEDAHTKKITDLYTHIAETTKRRDECLANADAALDQEDVDTVVNNRTIAEKCEREIHVYEELLKRAQKDVIVSREQVDAYVQGIKSEYHAREYDAYSKMLTKFNEIIDIIKELHAIHAEAHYCGNLLGQATRLTKSGINYDETSLVFFKWGFTIDRFFEETLPDGTTISRVKRILKDLEPYKVVEDEKIEEGSDENE